MARTVTNYISNPVFGNATTGYTPWRSTLAQSAAEPYLGTYSMTSTRTANGPDLTYAAPVIGGAEPEGSAWSGLVVVRGEGDMIGEPVQISLQWRNTSFASISGVTSESHALTDTYREIVLEGVTQPAGAHYLRLALHHDDWPDNNIGDVIRVGGFQLTPTANALPLFSGDSPNAVWTGTPHASTSILTLPDRRIFPILKVGSQQRIGPLRAGKA